MSGSYEKLFQRVLFPAYETGLRRRKTLAYLDTYQREQWLPPEQVKALQWTRLKKLLEHCYREVPYYRRQWRELGVVPDDIRSLDDYAELPVLTRTDMRNHFEELKADSWRDGLLYKATGGSTGEPVRFGYTRESNDRRTSVMWRGYGWAGSRMGRRTLYLWGAVGDPHPLHQIKENLYNSLYARRVVNSFHMTEATMAEYADAIDQYRPEIIVAYVGPLLRLAQWLIATGRKIWQPQGIIGAAEALHDFQRKIIEQAFDCPAYNTYGCREFMLIASECEKRKGLHVNADHLLVELRRPDQSWIRPDCADNASLADHATGEVVVTDLFNYGMPFVRYLNGDVATASATPCDCGRGLPLISRVDGRKLDTIRTRDGHVLPGQFFPFMLKDVKGLERFQLVQRELDRLDLSIVRGPTFDTESMAYLRSEFCKILGDSIELRCHFVDDIPLTPSGKLRVTVSELST
jgi:phenylacetate-CoA ligase